MTDACPEPCSATSDRRTGARSLRLRRQRGEGLSEYGIIVSIVVFCGVVVLFNGLVSSGNALIKWSGCIICDEAEELHVADGDLPGGDFPSDEPPADPFEDDAAPTDDQPADDEPAQETPGATNETGSLPESDWTFWWDSLWSWIFG